MRTLSTSGSKARRSTFAMSQARSTPLTFSQKKCTMAHTSAVFATLSCHVYLTSSRIPSLLVIMNLSVLLIQSLQRPPPAAPPADLWDIWWFSPPLPSSELSQMSPTYAVRVDISFGVLIASCLQTYSDYDSFCVSSSFEFSSRRHSPCPMGIHSPFSFLLDAWMGC